MAGWKAYAETRKTRALDRDACHRPPSASSGNLKDVNTRDGCATTFCIALRHAEIDALGHFVIPRASQRAMRRDLITNCRVSDRGQAKLVHRYRIPRINRPCRHPRNVSRVNDPAIRNDGAGPRPGAERRWIALPVWARTRGAVP